MTTSLLRRLFGKQRGLELTCVLPECIARQLDEACPADLNRQARNARHEWHVEPVAGHAAQDERVSWCQLLSLPVVMRLLLLEGHPTIRWAASGEENIRDCDGYVPGIYEVDAQTLRAFARVFKTTVTAQTWGAAPVVHGRVEDTQRSAEHSDSKRPVHAGEHIASQASA